MEYELLKLNDTLSKLYLIELRVLELATMKSKSLQSNQNILGNEMEDQLARKGVSLLFFCSVFGSLL